MNVDAVAKVKCFFKDKCATCSKRGVACIEFCFNAKAQTKEDVGGFKNVDKVVCPDSQLIVCGDAVDACFKVAKADVQVEVVVKSKIDVNAKFGEVKAVCQ